MGKTKVMNPARFWTGIVLMAVEIIAGGIWYLTTLRYDWITTKVLGMVAIVLYNILAGILIWNGSEINREK